MNPAHNRQPRSVAVAGEFLQLQRLAQQMTQAELARSSGLSERTVRLAESGGPIAMTSIDDLADALQLPSIALVESECGDATDGSGVEKLKRFMDRVWNRHDLSVVEEVCLPEFQFYHERGIVGNQDEMRDRIQEFWATFSETEMVVNDAADYGSFVVCHWCLTMTHSGIWFDLPPTGKRFSLPGTTWVQVVRGRLGDGWDFWKPKLIYDAIVRDRDEIQADRIRSTSHWDNELE